MLVAPATRRRSPRPDPGDRSRPARAAKIIACAGELGFGTIRDGLRWHLIEKSPGQYDWSSWMPALEAAEQVGLQVIWDLFHYGSPDHVDQARRRFPERFTEFALAALEVQQSVSGRPPLVCPLNEINFLSWAVEDGYFPRVGPDERGWFKRQLIAAAISAGEGDPQRWPNATHRLGRASGPHRAARPPPRRGARRRGSTARASSRPMTGSSAGPSRSLAATRRWST